MSANSSVPESQTVYLYFAYVGLGGVAFTRAELPDGLTDSQWVQQTAWMEPHVDLTPQGEVGQLPVLAIGPDRAVHCAWVRATSGAMAIMHTFSTGDGAAGTWSAPATIVSDQGVQYKFFNKVGGKFRAFQMPGIATDPRDGMDIVYVSYTAYESGAAQDLNLYVSKGVSDGMGDYTWQSRALVTPPDTDPAGCAQGQELDQFFSAITVDERGWVHVIWQEACDTGDLVQPDVYTGYAYSTDGGQSFTRMRLTPDPLVPGSAVVFIGDYLGLSSVGNRVYALYPNGPVHLGYGDFTIYSTRIDIGVNEADFNGDCVVDLNDYSTLANCFTGSGNMPDPGCFMCNLADGDCDVDLNDFNEFSLLFGTSGCPGGEGAAAGGALPPDPGALAVWTVGHVPGPARETFAGRCRDLATRTADQSRAAVLEAFAGAITP